MTIVFLGEPMVEFNQRTDGLFDKGLGGDVSNAAISCARNGGEVTMASALGDDAFGDDVLAIWRNEGIDTSGVVRDPQHPTGLYFVTHDETGHHYTYRRSGSAASHYRFDETLSQTIRDAQHLHVSAISQAISDTAADTVFKALDTARASRTAISYDTNLRLNLWPLKRARGVIHEAMTLCDIALPSIDDAVQLTGLTEPDAIVDFYLNLGATRVVLKRGAEGALIADGDTRDSIPPLSVNTIDTNAAGDTFAGALLAELARGQPWREAATYANKAAGISTTGKGAVTSIPRRDQVEAFVPQ